MRQKGSASVYEKLLHKQQQSQAFSTSMYQSDKKSKDFIKSLYSTPSKSKINQTHALIEEDPKSSYTDYEVSRYLSCIIQLKDHINYLNILMDNLLDALDRFRIDLNTKFTEYKTTARINEKIEGDRFEFDIRIKSVIKVLDEALYKNTDAITQFSNVTGHEQVVKTRASEKGFSEKAKERLQARGQSEKKMDFYKKDAENVESEEEFDKSVKASSDELKILRQENKYLKAEVKNLKTRKEEYKGKMEEYETDVKGIAEMRKAYEGQLEEVEKEKERLINEYENRLKELESENSQCKIEVAEKTKVAEESANSEKKIMILEAKVQSMREQTERLIEELTSVKSENDSLRTQAAVALKNQETNVKAIEYKEQSIKFKTLLEQKEQLLLEEKDKNEWMSKELQRAKNELFAVQLEKGKKEKELFNCTLQLKELQSNIELEREKRKKVEEDKDHYAKMIEMDETKGTGDEEQSLLSAIKELCLLVLSKRKESTMSHKTKTLINDIFQDNFIYLLDIYDKYMCEVGDRNSNLEKLLRSQYEKILEYSKLVDSFTDFLGELLSTLDGNMDVESLKDIIARKHGEVLLIQNRIIQDTSDYKHALELLDVQSTQARELLEAELGGEEEALGINPYEYLRQYYKTIIEELKDQIQNLQKKIARGELQHRKPRRIVTTEDISPGNARAEKELSQALEGYHSIEKRNEELGLEIAELEKKVKAETDTKNSLIEKMNALNREKDLLVNLAIANAHALEEYIMEAVEQEGDS